MSETPSGGPLLPTPGELGGDGPTDVTREASAADMASTIAALRDVLAALRPCDGDHCAEREAYERAIVTLTRELRRLTFGAGADEGDDALRHRGVDAFNRQLKRQLPAVHNALKRTAGTLLTRYAPESVAGGAGGLRHNVVDSLNEALKQRAPGAHERLKRSVRIASLRRQGARHPASVVSALRAYGEIAARQLAGSAPDEGQEYRAWLETREPVEVARAAEQIRHLDHAPLISIVTPLYETPERVLRECVESVRAQSYAHWELLLVDDGSTSPHVRRVAGEYAQLDPRVRFERLFKRGGIARATNAALTQASGAFVAFLDHDDALAPHALAEVALRLQASPTADLIYSDEDKLDEKGNRCAPFFKPDWSPDLLRSANYVCHFLVARRSLIDDVGRVREGFEGAQDYDLILRLSERARTIAHIPHVLYHWRVSPVSMAKDVQNKPAASGAGRRALEEHLRRCGEAGEVEETRPTTYRVKYPVRGNPLVSIIVPFKDKPELLRQLLGSLRRSTWQSYELLLVSNNSTEPATQAVLDSIEDARVRKLRWDHPFSYSAVNNFAVREAKGEILLFLNNDIEVVDPPWMEELIGQVQRPEVGAVGPKLLFPNGTIQHAGAVVGITGFAGHPFTQMPDDDLWTPFGHPHWTRNFSALTGACLAVRRDLFDEVGGFDERFIVCGSDVELCLRLGQGGRRIVYTPHTKLVHHESASRRGSKVPEVDFWRSFVAYRALLKSGDPFYNPNLTLADTTCRVRDDARTGEALAVEKLASWDAAPFTGTTPARARVQRHLVDHLSGLDGTAEELRQWRARHPSQLAALQRNGSLQRITWFVPYFEHPYGGVHTILRFASLLKQRHGVQSHFVVYNNPGAMLEARSSALFAETPGTFQVLAHEEEAASVAPSDLSIATFWTSAYVVARHENASAKAFFVQDFEPAFYPAGSEYGLAEQAYRLGLYGIFNTKGLHDYVTANYPMQGCWFEPTVDHDVFHDRRPDYSGPVRVFFYGRPSSDRNAFELGLAALSRLKARFGSGVRIFSAGEKFDPEQFGVQRVIENIGVLPYERTADLYRSCDVGLCFMFTKHTSYLPLEMMACGVTVVTNDDPTKRWLLEPEQNSLAVEPTVSCIVEALERAVGDADLRKRLGLAAAARLRRTTWEEQVDRVYASLLGTSAAAETVAPMLRQQLASTG